MEENCREMKELILKSIRRYLDKKRREGINYHVIEEIFPVERRIRAIIGGLETSFGETVWEPLSKMLAKKNDFLIYNKKDFKRPKRLPKELEEVIEKWKSKRENSKEKISLDEYINEIRSAVKLLNIDYSNVEYTALIKGQGIDLWIEKDNIEYIFDIKTTQINAGDGNKFNEHILKWYAYRIFKNPDVQIRAFIAIPFNPFDVSWESKMGGRAKPLIIDEDIIIAENFWSFISGNDYSYNQMIKAFKELKNENLLEEYKDVIYGESKKEIYEEKNFFQSKYKFLELFAGVGGSALGLEKAGFENIGLIESDKLVCNTLRKNRSNWNVIEKDIVNVAKEGIYNYIDNVEDIDLLSGRCPCRPFSCVGNKSRTEEQEKELFYYYAEILSQLKPKIFFTENVKNIVNHNNGEILKTMIDVFSEIGYTVEWKILNALDYDSAHNKERVIIIGIRNDLYSKGKFEFPNPNKYQLILKDVLCNVPPSKGKKYNEELKHILNSLFNGSELSKDEKEKISKYRINRASWEKSCPSLIYNIDHNIFSHPDEVRPFTIRECARIDTFPDSWEFEGQLDKIYKQMSDSLPVNFSRAIGSSIKRFLDSIE